MGIKRKTAGIFLFILLICTVCTALPVTACADIATCGQGESCPGICLAGNADLYPLEYYDETRECYMGIIPEMWEHVSSLTGLSFYYHSGGNTVSQAELAAGGEAQIVSIFLSDGSIPYSDTLVLGTMRWGDKFQDVCIAFRGDMDKRTVKVIKDCIKDIPPQSLPQFGTEFEKEQGSCGHSHTGFWIIITVLALMVAALGVFIVMLSRRRKGLEKEVLTDSFTGIGNRRFFTQRFDDVLNDSNVGIYYMADICFDINWANQCLGSDETNKILQFAADTIKRRMRPVDNAARVFGGGFAILYPAANIEEAEARAESLITQLNTYDLPCFGEGRPLFRAGVFALGGSECSCEQAISCSAFAYRRAVEDKVNVRSFDENSKNEALLEQKIIDTSTHALENGEFMPYLQFLVDTRSNNVIGAELLSRWEYPGEGLLRPSQYISIMEQNGSIVELDFYMFEQACRQLEKWNREGLKRLFISCNFSRHTISTRGYMKRLMDIASKYDFDRSRMIIEITEAIMESNKELALSNAYVCREYGFRLALDDVGSGFTSFTNLTYYPVDIIKLDAQILHNATCSERGAILMRDLTVMGHNMGLKVACEGVETVKQDDLVKKASVDYIQGFYYSHPIPAADSEAFMEHYRLSQSAGSKA